MSAKRAAQRVLVVDVGGTHVKILASGHRVHRRIMSGPGLTPDAMVSGVIEAARGWAFDVVSVGFPGPVVRNVPTREPWNLGQGWARFDFQRAFGRPVRLINDAAMQAIGSYDGGRMLFLGLGTGLGTTLIRDTVVVPMELAHLPYRNGKSYEQYVGEAGMLHMGKKRWRKHVAHIVDIFSAAFETDYIVLGGGNVRHIKKLPPHTRRGDNANAFVGGFRLWTPEWAPDAVTPPA